MNDFICPVCGEELKSENKSLSCENNHRFDKAKSGYVNLLLSQRPKTRHHGDNKLMVNARRDFLNRGYYDPLVQGVCEEMKKHAGNGCRILDAGCGECFYTAHAYNTLIQSGFKPEMLAVDISKDALAAGANRCRDIRLAVASLFRLPVKDKSCDMLISIFAPFCREEFHRVLRPNGVMIRVIPLERHLWQLKKAVYDSPYENEVEGFELQGFELLGKKELRRTIRLSCSADILHVFTMTPYYYKTSAKDQEKLNGLSELDTEIEFGILTYAALH